MATTRRFGSLNLLTGKDGQVPEYLIDGVSTSISNRVVVNTASDFPAAVSGVRPLASNTQYYIGTNDVDVGTDRFSVGTNTSLKGAPGGSLLTSTTTGDLFTGGDAAQFTIESLNTLAVSARIFNITDTTPSTVVTMINSIILAADSVGLFTGVASVNFTNSAAVNINDGIETAGVTGVISARQFQMVSASATFKAIDLGAAVSPTIEFTDLSVTAPAGAFGISGLASSGNVASGSIASVTSCEFLGGMTALETITVDDIRWRFLGNSGIADTDAHALIFLLNNVTETVIDTINTPLIIAGTYTVHTESIYDGNTSGRITYLGERPITARINATMTAFTTTGAAKDVTFYVAKNGSIIANSGISNNVRLNVKGNSTMVWQEDLVEDDFIEIFVENNDDTTNITVEDMNISVSS